MSNHIESIRPDQLVKAWLHDHTIYAIGRYIDKDIHMNVHRISVYGEVMCFYNVEAIPDDVVIAIDNLGDNKKAELFKAMGDALSKAGYDVRESTIGNTVNRLSVSGIEGFREYCLHSMTVDDIRRVIDGISA